MDERTDEWADGKPDNFNDLLCRAGSKKFKQLHILTRNIEKLKVFCMALQMTKLLGTQSVRLQN